MGPQPICGPLPRAAQSHTYGDNPAQYRQSLTQMLRPDPALWPNAMPQGCPLHDCDRSVQQNLSVRRITVQATGAVFALRPSCVRPARMARPAEVAKGLSRRQWGVPFEALASVLGRDALCWSRAWLACGRPALRGTTVQAPQTVPPALGAAEQVTWGAGQEGDVPTTVGGGCVLGGRVVAAAETAALETGYGACAREARALAPTSQPHAVCPEGGHATREAWRRLCPAITLVRL